MSRSQDIGQVGIVIEKLYEDGLRDDEIPSGSGVVEGDGDCQAV
jgi:hypothetical protein